MCETNQNQGENYPLIEMIPQRLRRQKSIFTLLGVLFQKINQYVEISDSEENLLEIASEFTNREILENNNTTEKEQCSKKIMKEQEIKDKEREINEKNIINSFIEIMSFDNLNSKSISIMTPFEEFYFTPAAEFTQNIFEPDLSECVAADIDEEMNSLVCSMHTASDVNPIIMHKKRIQRQRYIERCMVLGAVVVCLVVGSFVSISLYLFLLHD